MTPRLDLSIYYITAPDGGAGMIATAKAAAQGGASAVQLREKTMSDADFVTLGRRLKRELDPLGVPLVINDRIDLVHAIGAQGGHIGQGDIPVAVARDLLGPKAVLGLSIEHEGQCAGVDWSMVDYVGAGPIYATDSKADHARPIGLDGLARIRESCACPIVAIGGIGVADVPDLRAAHVDGMAVISAIAHAPDPKTAAHILATAWRAS